MTWSRKSALATAPPVEVWPKSDDFNLSESDSEELRIREAAMRHFMAEMAFSEITKLTGLHRNQITNLAKKCLSLAADGNIHGFRGLLPYFRTAAYVRSSPIGPKREEQHGGMSGALSAVFSRFPDIEQELIRLIRKEKRRLAKDGIQSGPSVHEVRIKPSTLQRIFCDELRRRGITDLEWPFTTKYRGRRTIQQYMKLVSERNPLRTVETRESNDARAHMATGGGFERLIPYAEPYDAVEIDAYHIDAFVTAVFGTPEGTEAEVVLSRLWILAIVERLSTAVLAYRLVFRSEVGAADVAALIRDAISGRWEPKQLSVRGLQYPKKGGFPSGVLPEAQGAVWSVTMLDGALANLAKLIHDTVRKTAGFVINWGPPGHFERRPNIERTFKKISTDLFHRLPSTTGSSPRSGRANDPVSSAQTHRIRATEIEELIDVVFAEHNGLPCERNSFNSPLETLGYFMSGPDPKTLVRKLPNAMASRASLIARRQTCTVRGGLDSGRKPYIQFENVRYSSSVLGEAVGLVGKKLIIHIDESDLRQVTAFLSSGAELGILKAAGKWSLTKHDLKTRKTIFQLITKRILALTESADPVHEYMKHISLTAPGAKKGAQLTPKQATEAVRVAHDANVAPILGKVTASQQKLSKSEVTPTPDSGKRRFLLPPPSEELFKTKNR